MDDAHAQQVLQYIGANVSRLRRERGLTQEKLAEAAGIETNYVQMIEYVKTNPSVKVLVNLADALGVEAKALLEPAEMQKGKRGRPPKKP
ncbi:MAG: helix-turn-helix transcriptional regulator [Byssovorax sp.]